MRKLPETAKPRAPKARVPLTRDEIIHLDAALVRAFRAIQDLRRETPAARYIKFPPLPSIFSESIVIAAAPCIFGPEWVASYGGATSDVVIRKFDGEQRRVEVKATGEHAFQEFKAKDLRADLLVWIRFGRRFSVGTGPIEVAILNEPGKFIDTACRLDTTRFEKRIGADTSLKVVAFGSLEALLG